eukprot:scaffold4824_cov28-Tisochrysis_lutea.AAC.2
MPRSAPRRGGRCAKHKTEQRHSGAGTWLRVRLHWPDAQFHRHHEGIVRQPDVQQERRYA